MTAFSWLAGMSMDDQKTETEKQICEMMNNGIIRRSTSLFASDHRGNCPLVLTTDAELWSS